MPPHLHPRSRLTTSLFGTTLLVSFLVVALPHLLPCPAPRTAHADSERASDGPSRPRRRRRPSTGHTCGADSMSGSREEGKEGRLEEEGERGMGAREARKCPVPKPRGVVAEVLGFGREDRDAVAGRLTRVEEVERGGGDG